MQQSQDKYEKKHNKKRSYKTPLPLIHLEGAPGTGKSQLALKVFQQLNIKYKHIKASTPFDTAKQWLIDAFNNGKAILIDEMNAYPASAKLERLLNELSTGKYKGNLPNHLGFMDITTANSSEIMSGRQRDSKAIKARSLTVNIDPCKFSNLRTALKTTYNMRDKHIDNDKNLQTLFKQYKKKEDAKKPYEQPSRQIFKHCIEKYGERKIPLSDVPNLPSRDERLGVQHLGVDRPAIDKTKKEKKKIIPKTTLESTPRLPSFSETKKDYHKINGIHIKLDKYPQQIPSDREERSPSHDKTPKNHKKKKHTKK